MTKAVTRPSVGQRTEVIRRALAEAGVPDCAMTADLPALPPDAWPDRDLIWLPLPLTAIWVRPDGGAVVDALCGGGMTEHPDLAGAVRRAAGIVRRYAARLPTSRDQLDPQRPQLAWLYEIVERAERPTSRPTMAVALRRFVARAGRVQENALAVVFLRLAEEAHPDDEGGFDVDDRDLIDVAAAHGMPIHAERRAPYELLASAWARRNLEGEAS